MGLRFRKSFKLAPGVRMNFSGSGASMSLGPRGTSVSVGSRGVYGNVGLPGTGLSARSKLSGRASAARRQNQQTVSMAASIGVSDDGNLFFQDGQGDPLPEQWVQIAKKQNGDAIRGLIQAKCDEINAQIEAVGELHLGTPDPSRRPTFAAKEYAFPLPIRPAPRVLGFFAKLFPAKRLQNELENKSEDVKHRTLLEQWESKFAEHKAVEAERRIRIESLIYSDPEAMERHLEEALQEIAWPRETLVSADLRENGATVYIDVDLPEIEDMPSKTADVPVRGLRLSVKEMSATQIQRLYMRHVHAIGFRIIGETFFALPKAEEIVLSGFSQRRNKATGSESDEYLYSVRVERKRWNEIEFSRSGLKEIDVVESLARFNLRRSMSKTGVFKPIEPFSANELHG